jgi:hypothetical protein
MNIFRKKTPGIRQLADQCACPTEKEQDKFPISPKTLSLWK